ncbi:MAG TPA: PTS glucose transporter subunit IIA, partial [Propionibacteriaceae bacterium]|nr:PTS glucose transporter subunit IIA [Propionibacteriaceae bacterium]
MTPTPGHVTLIAPLSGVLVPIERVPDPVFAEKMVGEGISIDPTSNVLLAPVDGEITLIHPSQHAVTVRHESGLEVLLHIGLDTFRPVTEERIEDHRIHTEYCRLRAQAAATINRAESEGRRVIAVGTTSVRVLETAARAAEGAGVRPWDGPTDLFIT